MKIVSIIPARSGSKGIPDKNIAYVGKGNKTLLGRSVITSVNSIVDETWVSTDSERYKEIAEYYGAKVIMRPKEISGDHASSESVLLHFAENVDFDILVFLQCTSPLTTAEDINNSINMIKSLKYDSVLSGCPDHGGFLCGGFTWTLKDGKAIADYDIMNRPRRQDMDPKFRENGAIYVTTREQLLKSKNRLGGNIGLYVMPTSRSFEIDEPEDLEMIRKYYIDE